MVQVLGLDISKMSASAWVLTEIPADPKRYAKKHRELKLTVSPADRDKLLALEFDFAVLEPTGVYSRIWRHWLRQAGREYRLVGHKELAHYRDGWKMQKTDKLDGLAIAMYGVERCNRPDFFLIENDYKLSDLILLHQHLRRQKNGFQNNLRQRLAYQIPEWYSRKMVRPWGGGVPGLLDALRGHPSAKWAKEIEASCGVGLGLDSEILANILAEITRQVQRIEHAIDTELQQPQYAPYLRVGEQLGFSSFLIACLIAYAYPFEQFLSQGKRRITHVYTRTNNIRVRKDESLAAFKLACGLGLIWHQSGDFSGWVAGGNGEGRQNLRNSVSASWLAYKRRRKQGAEPDPVLELVKHKYDSHGMMRVARRWVEAFYRGLVAEFNA